MIIATNISKSFGKKPVLESLSLEISPGEVVAILGKNGAGKSTLLNILSNIVDPDNGSVSFDGKTFKKHSNAIYRQLGIQSQYNTLIEELTGYEFLRFTGMVYAMNKYIAEQQIEHLTKYFLLANDDLHKSISSYSSGMKKKIRLCSVLLHNPRYLLLDEPFANLDPLFSDLLCKLIDRYKIEKRTVVFASHDLLYVEKIANRICIIRERKAHVHARLSFLNGNIKMEDVFLDTMQTTDAKNDDLLNKIVF